MAASAGPEIERPDRPVVQVAGPGPALGSARGLALLKKRDTPAGPAGGARWSTPRAKARTCSVCGSLDTSDPCAALLGRDARQPPAVRGRGGGLAVGHGARGSFKGLLPRAGRAAVGAWTAMRTEALRVGELLGRANASLRSRRSSWPCRPPSTARTGPLPGRPPGADGRLGHHAGARRARGRRPGLAGRRDDRPGAAGETAGLAAPKPLSSRKARSASSGTQAEPQSTSPVPWVPDSLARLPG